MAEVEWDFFRKILNYIAMPDKISLKNVLLSLIEQLEDISEPDNEVVTSLISAVEAMITEEIREYPEKLKEVAEFYESTDQKKALAVWIMYHHLCWLFLTASTTEARKRSEKVNLLKRAIKHLEEEFRIADKLNHKQLKKAVRGRLGKTYRNLGVLLRKEARLPDALKAFEKSLAMHKSISDRLGIAREYAMMGVVLKDMGRLEEALESHMKALKKHKKLKDKIGMAKDYANIGIVYRHKGELEKALQNHMKSLEIRKEIGDKLGMARDYASIGMVLVRMGRLEEAFENLRKSIEMRKEIDNKPGMARDYETIGIILKNMGRLEEALESHMKALKIYEELNDNAGIARSYGCIGVVLKDLGKLSQALQSHQKALNIHKEIGDKLGMARDYASIGIVYRYMGKFDDALRSHMKALKIHRELHDSVGEARDYASIGIVLAQKGIWEDALENLKNSLKIREKLNDKIGIIRTHASMGIALAQMGKFEKAEREAEKGLRIAEEAKLFYATIESQRALRFIRFKKAIEDGFKRQNFCKAAKGFKQSWENGSRMLKLRKKSDFNLLTLAAYRIFDLLCKVERGETSDFKMFQQELYSIANKIASEKEKKIAPYLQELIYALKLEKESGFLQSEHLTKKIGLILEGLGMQLIMKEEESAILVFTISKS